MRSASAASGSPWVTNTPRDARGAVRSQARISSASASAYADAAASCTTSARTGTSCPWIRTVEAPAAMCAPRLPPAWKP